LRIKQKIWNLLFVGDLGILIRICRSTQFSNGPTLANSIIGAPAGAWYQTLSESQLLTIG